MDSMLQTMLQCSVEQADELVSAYQYEHGWHSQTVIGAAGALLGHAIQASAYSMAAQGTAAVTEFVRPTKPPFGKFVNCDERIGLFVDAEFALLVKVASQLDWFAPDDVPDMRAIVLACVDQIGGEWFPRLSVDASDMPREWSPDAVPRFARKMRVCLDNHNLPHNVCEVLCLALAVGHLVALSKDRVDPAIGLRIGLEMAIATANIGNLDRPHVAFVDEEAIDLEAGLGLLLNAPPAYSHDEDDALATLDEDDYEALVADDVFSLDDADTASEGESLNGGDLHDTPFAGPDEPDEDGELPAPRASRLSQSRSRPKYAAFGKRQFG